MVRTVFKAILQTGLVERVRDGLPCFFLEPVADDWTIRAVEVVGERRVGLQLAEERQTIFEPPLVVAPRLPGVVVLRHSSQEDLAVDG